MSEQTSAAPAAEPTESTAPVETADTSTDEEDAAPANDNAAARAANDNGGTATLSDEDISALADAKAEADATGTDPTVTIGDMQIPLSALTQYLAEQGDDVLKQVKRKVKSNGKEREVSLFDALEAVPQADGWQKKQWEAAQERKQLEAIAQKMGTDPYGALIAMGKSEDEALDILAGQLKQRLDLENMTPEQRAEYERMRTLEEKAKRADEYEEEQKRRKLDEATEKTRTSYLKSMKAQLEAVGAKASKYSVGRMAHLMDVAIRDGVVQTPTDADFRWAAEQVQRELEEERASFLPDDADGEALLARLGDAKARKIAQAYAKKIRAAQGAPTREPGAKRPERKQPSEPETWDQYLARKDREMGIRR